MPRLLVVDDDSAIRFALREYLRSRGHEVDTAPDFEAAAEQLAARHYDAVVTDLRILPGEVNAGLDFVGRARKAAPRARLVVLSSYVTDRAAQEARQRGADAVLLKPEELSVIAEILERPPEGPRPPAKEVEPMKKRVLLVDDSNTVLLMEWMILKDLPLEFVTAADGQEAVDKARSQRPDLILMDVMMPRLDGFEAVRRLRADEATRAIPIIMVTTRGEGQNLERGYDVGCSDYVTKPIDGIELVTKVRNCLGEL